MADTARYKKIYIYERETGSYLGSTNRAKNLKVARQRYATVSAVFFADELRAEYAK